MIDSISLLWQAYADYYDMMDLAEEVIRACADAVVGQRAIEYQGEVIDLGEPFRRASMHDLVKEAIGARFLAAWCDTKSLTLLMSL